MNLVSFMAALRSRAGLALGVLLLGAVMLMLRSHRHRLQREKQRLSVITEQMADGLYVMDATGRALYVNQAACRVLGYSEQELRGQEIHRLIHQHARNGQMPLQECPPSFKPRCTFLKANAAPFKLARLLRFS